MKTVSKTNHNSENSEAEKFAKWLRLHGYYSTHIANESGLPKKIAMFSMIRKKRMGLSQWFPDYMIVLKRGSLLFIELKKRRSIKKNGEYSAYSTDSIDISPEQVAWIDKLDEIDNVGAFFAFWAEEAKAIVRREEIK